MVFLVLTAAFPLEIGVTLSAIKDAFIRVILQAVFAFSKHGRGGMDEDVEVGCGGGVAGADTTRRATLQWNGNFEISGWVNVITKYAEGGE